MKSDLVQTSGASSQSAAAPQVHTSPQSAQQQAWEALRAEFLRRVDAIDSDTPYGFIEPAWWLHMQRARRVVEGKA